MQTILCLVENHRIRSVHDLIGDFLATMGGQAMHEERVICRQVHELGIDLEALELSEALVVFVFIAHRCPRISDNNISTGNSLTWIIEELDRGAGHRRDLLALGNDDGIGRVDGRKAEPHVHARQHAHLEIGVRHVITVAHIGNRKTRELALVLANR